MGRHILHRYSKNHVGGSHAFQLQYIAVYSCVSIIYIQYANHTVEDQEKAVKAVSNPGSVQSKVMFSITLQTIQNVYQTVANAVNCADKTMLYIEVLVVYI